LKSDFVDNNKSLLVLTRLFYQLR